MFKVVLNKGVWNGESKDFATFCALYKKEITLPFVPSESIKIRWETTTAVAPLSVYWDIEEQHFVCLMPDEFERSVLSDKIGYDRLKSFAEKQGWTLEAEMNASEVQ